MFTVDAFVVFSQAIPSQSLGFVDSKASELSVSVGDKHFTIRQSRSLLTSNRKEGTTGAGSRSRLALGLAVLGFR